jgi:hypothetical protein
MVIELIGRRLRLAVIGGGPGSEIGEVHRIAARLDGYYDILAAALSLTLSGLGNRDGPSASPKTAPIRPGER